jgi:hypothetical protein
VEELVDQDKVVLLEQLDVWELLESQVVMDVLVQMDVQVHIFHYSSCYDNVYDM